MSLAKYPILTAFKQSFPVNLSVVVIVLVGDGDLCLILRLGQTFPFWCFTDLILVQYMRQVSHRGIFI